MFRVVKKLKALKAPLRKLVFDQGNLHTKVSSLRKELDDLQRLIDVNPKVKSKKQKAKIEWLKAFDSNTAYFHNMVKSKVHRCRIERVVDSQDCTWEGNEVTEVFVKHY